jgi:hypothetical protein
MLDWTTSFLSDKTILNPDFDAVKQFLMQYDMWWLLVGVATSCRCPDKKKPRILCGA